MIAIATREAVASDDLHRLETEVLATLPPADRRRSRPRVPMPAALSGGDPADPPLSAAGAAPAVPGGWRSSHGVRAMTPAPSRSPITRRLDRRSGAAGAAGALAARGRALVGRRTWRMIGMLGWTSCIRRCSASLPAAGSTARLVYGNLLDARPARCRSGARLHAGLEEDKPRMNDADLASGLGRSCSLGRARLRLRLFRARCDGTADLYAAGHGRLRSGGLTFGRHRCGGHLFLGVAPLGRRRCCWRALPAFCWRAVLRCVRREGAA